MHFYTMLRATVRTVTLIAVFSAVGAQVFAGGEIIHTPVTSQPEGQPVYFETAFTIPVERAYLNYRRPGQAAFVHFEMSAKVSGKFGAYVRELNDLKKGDVIEYYISGETRDGREITLPAENPEYLPFQMVVTKKAIFQETGTEVIILSPDVDAKVDKNDVVIAVSLFSEKEVDVKNLRLKLDGDDVTSKADVTAELVTYSPKGLSAGQHAVRLMYITGEGETQIMAEWTFEVVTEGAEDILGTKGFKPATDNTAGGTEVTFEDGTFRANGRTEFKSQDNLGETTVYKRAGADLSYEKKWFQVGATFDWDSEDDPRKNQPLSRYQVYANFDNIAIVNYGDNYPTFSPVTLNGTRVRGVSAGVFFGVFNFEFVSGQVNRKVLSKQDEIYKNRVDSIFKNTPSDTIQALQSYFDGGGATYAGTFERNLTGGRFSIGPQAFQLGFSMIKTKDAVGGLVEDPITSIGFAGTAPQENLVVGADFRTSMFDKRFNFDASVASSVSNTDITSGSISKQTLDDAGIEIPKSAYDILNKFMTVNTNLSPIVTEWDPNLLAWTAGGSLNAYNNNLAVRYRYNGAYFQSFGASVARDLKSLEFSDRYRFWDNRIFTAITYATSENNLNDANANTIKTNNLGFSVSFFLPNQMPSVTLGYNNISRDNGYRYSAGAKFDKQISLNSRPEDNVTNVFSFSSTYGFQAMDLKNTATLTYSNSNKKDNSKIITASSAGTDTISLDNYYTPVGDAKNNNVGLSVTTEWKIPLRTTLSANFGTGDNQILDTTGTDQAGKAKSHANIYSASGEYTVLNKEEMRLVSYGGISLSNVKVPGIAALNLTSINLGSRFSFWKKNTLSLNYNLTSGLKIPRTDDPTKTKSATNSIFTARYEYIF